MIHVQSQVYWDIIHQDWEGLIRENDIFLVSHRGHNPPPEDPQPDPPEVSPTFIDNLVAAIKVRYPNNDYWARTNGLNNISILSDTTTGLQDTSISTLVLNYEPNDVDFSFNNTTMKGHIADFVTNRVGTYTPVVMPTGQATAGHGNEQENYYSDMLAQGPDTLIVQLQGRWNQSTQGTAGLEVAMLGDDDVDGLQTQLSGLNDWYAQITPIEAFFNGVDPESSALQVVRQTRLGVPHVMMFWLLHPSDTALSADQAKAWMQWHRQMIEAGGYNFTPAPMPP